MHLGKAISSWLPVQAEYANTSKELRARLNSQSSTSYGRVVFVLAKIFSQEINPELVKNLGRDFPDVYDFYSLVEKNIVPVLNQGMSRMTGADLTPMHASQNNNLRLIDYFSASNPTAAGLRCGEHRDYGTHTITF